MTELTICGHRLGCSLANLLARDVAANATAPFSAPNLYNDASPKTGNSLFASTCDHLVPNTSRIADRLDLVPKLSLPPLAAIPGSHHIYCLRGLGFTYLEGELRQQYTTTSEGRVGKERDSPGSTKMLEGMKKYTDIPVPAVIFAIPHAQGKWVDDSTDPKVREAGKAYSAAEPVLTTKQTKAFEDGVPTAHVVRLGGPDHYVYLTNQADVLREMKAFSAPFGSNA